MHARPVIDELRGSLGKVGIYVNVMGNYYFIFCAI